MVSATGSVASSGGGLTSESLSEIKLSELSQSELQALSLCSKSAFKPHNTDNYHQIITPNLNPSKSRRHTYYHRRRRLSPQPSPVAASDPTMVENKSILGYLKNLLGDDQQQGVLNHNILDCKKRLRDGECDDVDEKIELLNVNSNGVVVDFQELGNSDEYFNNELKKRTEGLVSEEQGLGFLKGLNGEWCSSRKKRKFVDASEFGDRFPVGWKILLGLSRRDHCVSVYCRRYVSPTGEHFVSCKEASLYLQSYFKDRGNQNIDQRAAIVHQAGNVTSGTHAGMTNKESDTQARSSPTLDTDGKEVEQLRMENLYEVQISSIFDCSKCNLNFDDKIKYISHMFQVHQNTTRRYSISAAGAEIINDNKNEGHSNKCRFEAEAGIHTKSNVQVTNQKSSESPLTDEIEMPSRAFKLDSFLEIAHNSVLDTSNDGPTEKPKSFSSSNNVNMKISATDSGHEQSLKSSVTNNFGDIGMEKVEPLHNDRTVEKVEPLHNDRTVEKVEPLHNDGTRWITSVCVWCAKKFTHEAVASVDETESVGFMCPACKAAISKHLDNGIHHC